VLPEAGDPHSLAALPMRVKWVIARQKKTDFGLGDRRGSRARIRSTECIVTCSIQLLADEASLNREQRQRGQFGRASKFDVIIAILIITVSFHGQVSRDTGQTTA